MNQDQATHCLVCLSSGSIDSHRVQKLTELLSLPIKSKKEQSQKLILTLNLSSSEVTDLRLLLPQASMSLNMDLALMPLSLFHTQTKLAVFDMDSTLIDAEVIDELAIEAGVGSQVKAITEKAMQGELNFDQSLAQRVALLKDLPESALEKVYQRISFNPGVEAALATLHSQGIKTALVSGGFLYFARLFAARLGMTYIYANELEIRDQKLTGKIQGEILNAQKKAEILKHTALRERLSLDQVVAVGDGANDLEMMSCAGKSVAFHAKPKVQTEAMGLINVGDMNSLLSFINLEGERLV